MNREEEIIIRAVNSEIDRAHFTRILLECLQLGFIWATALNEKLEQLRKSSAIVTLEQGLAVGHCTVEPRIRRITNPARSMELVSAGHSGT